MGRDSLLKGIAIVAINTNDAEKYPDDGPEKMKSEIELVNYPFPYLYGETQAVGKAYRAACTPDFFLFDADHRLVYHGQFNNARPGNPSSNTGQDLKNAMYMPFLRAGY
ncbi:MAG: hypothetical protein M2R46_04378 [Verrucomicrobia subdivision 3 bacterium]|nr:hypothetical protein [Limisphaerales bacterium]